MARSPILHIGYHKTGTSWLQRGLFVDADAGFATPWGSMEIANTLILPNDLTFDPEAARARLCRVETGELIPVVTWERLSGSPHAGGFDSACLARRLRAVFPEGRVVIAVREQRSMVYALYQQYVRDGGIATLDGYLRPRNPSEIPQFRWEHLEYDRLVSLYQELFGPERVLVLCFEDLVTDPQGFAASVVAHAGATAPIDASRWPAENTSFGAATIVAKRPFNRWFVRNSLSPGARYYVKDHVRRFERLDDRLPDVVSRPVASRWRATIEASAAGRYGASNRRLGELLGRDLAALGYDLG